MTLNPSVFVAWMETIEINIQVNAIHPKQKVYEKRWRKKALSEDFYVQFL